MEEITNKMNDESNSGETTNLPIIILHDVVGFPGCSIDFDILGYESEKAVEAAENSDGRVFLVAEREDSDPMSEKYGEDNGELNKYIVHVYNFGVIAKIQQHMKTSDRINRISVECENRATLREIYRNNGDDTDAETKESLMAKVTIYEDNDSEVSENEIIAAMRNVKGYFSEWSKYGNVSSETVRLINEEKNPLTLISKIVYCGVFDTAKCQRILEQKSTLDALELLAKDLVEEIEILRLQKALIKQAEVNLDSERRESIIREQINILNSQLDSDSDAREEENDSSYMQKISKYIDDPESQTHLKKEAANLSKLPPYSQEAYIIRNYLDTVLSLPWKNATIEKSDLQAASEILDKEHYGLKKVKQRIIETLAVRQMTSHTQGNIICLLGPPGTGKTSIARSIAHATGRKYVRVSLGGVRDEADIRGHRKTYLGAMPGRIAQGLISVKSNNPVMLLDEIDKMSQDFRGDPSSAMLEVLDSEQNHNFVDHYIEIPFDLGNVMFICTANDISGVPQPLIDRMEIIELSSYTKEEKFHIAKEHLVAKQRKKHGLKASQFKIADAAIYDIIEKYTREAGVRNLERQIATLCRKADKVIVEGNAKSLNVTAKKLEELLGPAKYQSDEKYGKSEVGRVNGMAWTSVGGVLLPIEAVALKGKGRLELTGSLGDVMQESAKIAVTLARTKAKKYGYREDFPEITDIHIHAPEGAVPKDGPSAGVTMATAVISALSGKKVRSEVAMTGEISLHGDVLPIGGLREKTMAAFSAGIKKIIIPERNKPDMYEVEDVVKENTEFVFAKNIDDVLDNAIIE